MDGSFIASFNKPVTGLDAAGYPRNMGTEMGSFVTKNPGGIKPTICRDIMGYD